MTSEKEGVPDKPDRDAPSGKLDSMPQSSAESNFRSNLSHFRWAQGVTDDSQPVQGASQPSNPFARFYHSVAGDYVPLRSNERSNEEEAWFALSRWEKYVEFPVHSYLILAQPPSCVVDYWVSLRVC